MVVSHRWNFLEVWPLDLFSCHFKLYWCLPKVSQYKTTIVKVLTVWSSCCRATQEWGTGEVAHTEVSSLVLEQLSVITGTKHWRSHMLWNLETKPFFSHKVLPVPSAHEVYHCASWQKKIHPKGSGLFSEQMKKEFGSEANEVNISSSHIFFLFLSPLLSFSCTVEVLYKRMVKGKANLLSSDWMWGCVTLFYLGTYPSCSLFQLTIGFRCFEAIVTFSAGGLGYLLWQVFRALSVSQVSHFTGLMTNVFALYILYCFLKLACTFIFCYFLLRWKGSTQYFFCILTFLGSCFGD